MDIAKKLAEKGEPEGSIVITERQVSGRGRFRRKWSSPVGGIYFSLILRPEILPQEVGKINIIAAVSLAETLRELYALPAKIKWPNDVLVREKKISGILTEAGIEGEKLKWVILGIGINVNNPQKKFSYRYLYPATSIKEELKKKFLVRNYLKDCLCNWEKIIFQ